MANSVGDIGPARDMREDLNSFSSHDRQVSHILRSVAWVTPLIVAANVLVFAAMAFAFGTVTGFDPLQLAVWGGNSGALDLAGQWWRLFSYQFLHINLTHVAVNMLLLWSVGRLTERLYGSITLLLLYLAAGAIAGLASIVWNPSQISVGASGSIFGVLGAFLAMLLLYRNEVPIGFLRYWLPALIFTVYNIFAGAYEPGVDNAAHIGGLIAGFGLGAVMARMPGTRHSFPLMRGIAASLLAIALALPPLWYMGAFGRAPSPLEKFAATHVWYVQGEHENLLLWQGISARMTQGTISTDESKRQFAQNILPFWQSASARLRKEALTPGREGDSVLTLISEFADMRLAWAKAILAALNDNTAQNLQAARESAARTSYAQAELDRLKLHSQAEMLPAPLRESAMAVRIRNLIPGLEQTCIEAPAIMEKPLSPGDAAGDGPARRHAIGCAAQRMFMSGDYAALDAAIKNYTAHLSDLPDGGSSLDGVWKGLDNLFTYGELPVDDAVRHTLEWRRAVKGSVEPDIAEAQIYRSWAYAARGFGYVSSVPPQAMALYLGRVLMAAEDLEDIGVAAKNDPMWYELSLSAYRDQSLSLAAQREIFDQGAAKFSGYLPLYRQMLAGLMPRWGGSTQAVDDFIREVSSRNGAIDAATYARLYLIYGNLEGNDFDVVKSAYADPALMKLGMAELQARYPRSDYILNSALRFACIEDEVSVYRALRPELPGHMSASAWPDKLTIARCDALNG